MDYEVSSTLKTENNGGTIFWALSNATLGAYIAFTLLSYIRERLVSGRRRLTCTVLAALALSFGSCACQLSTSRVHLELPDEAGAGVLFTFKFGLVVLSFIAATTLLFFGFLLLDFQFQERHGYPKRPVVWRLLTCSLLVGLSVCSMHYCPFLSLPLFKATFAPVHVFLVVFLIASGSASTLSIIFCINKYVTTPKYAYMLRALVSLVFGSCIIGAGMLSLSGVRFQPIGTQVDEPRGGDRKQRDVLTLAVPAAITITLTCSAIVVVFASRFRPKTPYLSIPRLTLASIAFDNDGRILVDQKGMLPTQNVSLDGLPMNILSQLDSSGTAFHWLLAISSNWSIISPFLPYITRDQTSPDKHPSLWYTFSRFLSSTTLSAQLQLRSESEAVPTQARLKLHLLEAATQLAAQLDLPLEKLGTLHGSVLETVARIGTGEALPLSNQGSLRVRDAEGAIKAGNTTGLILFFVRILPQQSSGIVPHSDSHKRELKGTSLRDSEADVPTDFGSGQQQTESTRGFKMLFMGRFRDVLSEATGAKPADVESLLDGCKSSATRRSKSVLEEGRTYVSLFVEQLSCDGTSEVLVYDFAKHQLPSYQLGLETLTREMRDWIHKMSGFTASDIIQICNDEVEQGRLLYKYSTHSRSFVCEEQQRQAALIVFKEVLAKALAQLMHNMCFVGESLETWSYLTPRILDVPSVGLESDKLPPAPAHMIVFHAEIPDPLDAEVLEVESDFSHISTCRSGRLTHTQQMPSVFEYIPRSLFEVVHALSVSPPAREAFREEATRELERITQVDTSVKPREQRKDDLDARIGPVRLSHALVSSFSIDSTSDGECGDRPTAVVTRVRKSWAAVKSRARALTLSPRKSQTLRDPASRNRSRSRNNQLDDSQSMASRTHLLSRSRSGSTSTATTSTATASYFIPEPYPPVASFSRANSKSYSRSAVELNRISRTATATVGTDTTLNPHPLPDDSDNRSSYHHSRSSSRSKSRSKSTSKLKSKADGERGSRWEESFAIPLPVSTSIPVPPLLFLSSQPPHRAVSSGDRPAFKSALNVTASKSGFF